MYIKTDVEGLVKDSKTGAILNVDNARLDAYRKQKSFMENNMRNSDRINKVEKDLNEIKEMLSQLLQRS